jgi:DNA-binding transcriptional regulator YiaG
MSLAARTEDATVGPITKAEGTDMDENAGNLIRTLRQKLGMTQEEFAHEIAVTVSTVNRWENAHAEPSKLAWKAIHDLARKRGLTDDILRRSGALASN